MQIRIRAIQQKSMFIFEKGAESPKDFCTFTNLSNFCPQELIFEAILIEFCRESDSGLRNIANATFVRYLKNLGFGLEVDFRERGLMSSFLADF